MKFLGVSIKNPKTILVINILINVLVGSVKWFGGIVGGSHALLADALETSSDIVSSIIILIGYNKAIQPPDHNHPYGHGKLESVTSFIIGIFLITSAAFIIWESVQSLLLPDKVPPKQFTIYIIGAVIVIKEILYRVFKTLSEKLHSSLFYTEALHHRTDAFTTIITFIGVSFALFGILSFGTETN